MGTPSKHVAAVPVQTIGQERQTQEEIARQIEQTRRDRAARERGQVDRKSGREKANRVN